MTELQLFKFIEDSGSETSFDGETAIMWVFHFNIDDFVKLIGNDLLNEGGFEVRLQEHYIAVEMNNICEHFEIELKNVFDKD